MRELTGFNVGTGQFTAVTEVNTNEFTLFMRKRTNQLRRWLKFCVYLRNETSYRYGWSWRYRRLQVQGWSGRSDLPGNPRLDVIQKPKGQTLPERRHFPVVWPISLVAFSVAEQTKRPREVASLPRKLGGSNYSCTPEPECGKGTQ